MKTAVFCGSGMVGATGIEPVTPTMSKPADANEIRDLDGLNRSKTARTIKAESCNACDKRTRN